MQRLIIRFPENRPENDIAGFKKGTVVALGKFDGTHIGHQQLLKVLADTAKAENLIPVVLLINTGAESIEDKEEQINRLFSFGAEAVAELELTPEVKNMSADRFLEEVLMGQLSMKFLTGGTDLSFGKDRIGNVEYLKKKSSELGFQYKLIEKIRLEGTEFNEDNQKTVSSTLLRQKIHNGDMEAVRNIMGKYYDIISVVVQGRHIGTDILGVPTLNQTIDINREFPPHGVYVSRVSLLPISKNAVYYGVSNLGVKPSIENGSDPLTLETHLFEFPSDKDLYGKTVKTELLYYLRPEIKFESLEELGMHLHEKDIPEAVKQIERIKNSRKESSK